MKKIIVYHYDAFSNAPNKGNPAGVVLDAESLTDKQMQEIAYKIGFNETAFIVKSQKADFGIRYFTPGHEMNLCGHATVATLYCLKSRDMLGAKNLLNIETKAGIIPINLAEQDKDINIVMGQNKPQFCKFQGSLERLADLLGIDLEDIDPLYPVMYGSTGTWTLLVPIITLEAFFRMKPKNNLFPSVLNEIPRSSIHPFCLETIKPYTHMHSRHFSSPYSGTIEDPVTGTASGVMGAYYIRYIDPKTDKVDLIMEQGQEVNRDGEVCVYVNKQGMEIEVKISGTAVYVRDIMIEYTL